MKFVDTFELHKSQPEITFDNYAKKKKVQLGEELSKKSKIYFDTKYWVLLCEAYLGREANKLQSKLLHLVIELHDSGGYIFPISEDIFLEVIKQTDESTLSVTVELIDKLSRGVTLVSAEERFQVEFFHFLEEKSGEEIHPLHNLVWNKLAYTMGLQTPTNPLFSEATNRNIQKAFLDQMWAVSLSDMVAKADFSSFPHTPDISEKLNKGKTTHINENNSFKQMFLSELAGILDINKSMFEEIMIYKYETATGQRISQEEYAKSNSGQKLANLVYHSFRLNKVTSELPSYRIIAGLHASTRWNTTQQYEANDMYDFRHAAAALPYCDYFFTEKRLCHQVTQKMLAYDQLYSCNVAWKLKEVTSTVEGIITSQQKH